MKSKHAKAQVLVIILIWRIISADNVSGTDGTVMKTKQTAAYVKTHVVVIILIR